MKDDGNTTGLILTREKYIQNMINNKTGYTVGIYEDQVSEGKCDFGNIAKRNIITLDGNKKENAILKDFIAPSSIVWENSEGHSKVWNIIDDCRAKIKRNYNQFDETLYYALIQALKIDITRRRMEQIDFTGILTREITNEAFHKSITLQEFLEYGGIFQEFSGTNEPAPLIEQRYGAEESVRMRHWHIGHTRSLLDELYDLDIYSFQKVLDAVARAWVALRNDLSVGQLPAISALPFPGGGWNPLQQVAAVNDPANTYEENLYRTYENAVTLLEGLFDPQTDQEINSGNMIIIVGTDGRAREAEKIVNGQLDRIGNKVQRLTALPVTQILPYKGDTIYWGKKKHTFQGVGRNTAYILVPALSGSPWYTLIKRQLTREIGRGDVLRHERERSVWYGAQTSWNREFFGTTDTAIAAAKIEDFPAQGFGWVVEIDLPVKTTPTT